MAAARDSIFQRILGDAWPALPAAVRALHGNEPMLRMAGLATVTRGRGWLARMVAAIVGFPAAGIDVPVEVQLQRDADGETWRRVFAGRAFSSRLRAGTGRAQGLIVESFGPVRVRIALVVEGDRLRFEVRGWSLWSLPLPRALAPGGDSHETQRDGRFVFHIVIEHPWTGPIVGYTGWLAPP
ncbi:MAG: DUF4166 domain-containing protein [Arenimonas sp.]